jgi:hypothetical protein
VLFNFLIINSKLKRLEKFNIKNEEKIEYESFNDVAKKIFEFEFNKFDIKSKKKFLIIILIIILSFWIVF